MSTDEIPQEWVDAACREFEMPLSGTVQERFAVALAAVLPLIEQRVIDRLAGTENPYAVHRTRDDDGKQIHYLHRGDPADGESGIAHRAWSEGAACGVAAERARTEELRAAGQALADLIVKEEDGMGREWYELASHWREVEIALSEWAALSPERATATDSLTEAQPVTEAGR